MDSGDIARFLLERIESEKLAFLGVGRAGRFLWNAASNNKGATAMGVIGTAALGPTMAREAFKSTPQSIAAKNKRVNLAHQASRGKYAMANKYAAAGISDADARQALAIRASLEKHAGFPGGIPLRAGDAAWKAAKQSPALKGAKNTLRALKDHKKELFMAGILLGAGSQVSGAAGMGVSHAVGKSQEGVQRAGRGFRFNAMLKADPSLKSSPQARTYFNVLQKASPFIANEPHVAAATVRSMLESPEGYALHPKVLKDILDIEGRRQDTRYPGMRVPQIRGEMPTFTEG